MTDEPEVVAEHRGAVLVVRINRPAALNALSSAVATGIGRCIADAEGDPGTRAIVLTGTGDRAFCTGMDLAEFAAGRPPATAATRPGLTRFNELLRSGRCELPLIGAANATALGGGFELLLACDLVVASSAAKFGLPEVEHGLFAAGGGTSLASRVPLAVALELTLTGEPLTADRAQILGLVNRVVPPGRVLEEAVELAARIATNAPLAVRATKELVRRAVSPRDDWWELHAELQAAVFSSEDAQEGARAFIEKRDPVWRGR